VVSERLRRYVRLEGLGRLMPVDPNVLTLLSAVVAWLGVPLVLLHGVPPWLFIAVSGVLDAVDGAVARARGLASRRGAFLDSFADRYTDAAYLLYFWRQADPLILLVAMVGTFTISYARCRGEALGAEVRGVGFMERGERVAYLFVASFFGGDLLPWLLAAYAVLVNAAALYRGFAVFKKLK